MMKRPKISFTVTISQSSYAIMEEIAEENNIHSRTKAIELCIGMAQRYQSYIEAERKNRIRKQIQQEEVSDVKK